MFDHLCDFQRKSQINEEIQEIKARSILLNIIPDNRIEKDSAKLSENEIEAEARIAALKREIAEIEAKPNKKISCGDVWTMLKVLKQKISKKQVEEMIWEVDEDLDECIDWTEFRLMFTRNAIDRTGLESSKMFNLTQFLIYDHNLNGRVSVDETMNMLYAR